MSDTNQEMRVKWIRDQLLENALKELGVLEWEVITVPIKEIDFEYSGIHQARIGPKFIEDLVVKYSLLMQNSSPFKMGVIQKLRKDSYYIWGGNHRYRAADLFGEKEVQAYSVSVKDLRVMDILPVKLNVIEGRSEDREQVMKHVIHWIKKHRFNCEEASKMVGIDPKTISYEMRIDETTEKISNSGVKIKKVLPKTIVAKLAPIQISGNRNVLSAIVKLIDQYSMNAGAETWQMIDDVKSKDTENQQIAEVAKWEKLLEGRKPKDNPKVKLPYNRAKRTQYINLLTRLDKMLSGVRQASQLQLDDSDLKMAAEMWLRISNKTNCLMKEGKV